MGDRDLAERHRRRCASCRARSSCARPGSRRWRGRRSTRSGTSWPATSPTASSRAPHGPPGTSPPPRGSSRRPPSGSKTSPTSSPTTTRPPSSSPGPPGKTEQAAELEAPALRFLTLAGERALGLDTAAALASFERALALTPAGHPERAAALARFGEAAFHAGRYGEAKEALEEAIAPFRAAGDLARRRPGDGHARHRAQPARRIRGGGSCPRRRWRCWSRCRPARSSSPRSPRSPRAEALQGRTEAGIGYAEQALALAEELGLPRPARALGYRGLARCRPRRSGAASTTSGRRSRSPPRPGRDARSPSCTTTSRSRSGRSKAPPQPWRCCGPGSPSRRPAGSPRSPTCSRPACSTRSSTTGEHEQALDPRRRARRRARGERERVRPHRGAERAGPDPDPARAGQPRSRTRSTGSKPPPARQGTLDYIVIGLGAAALARAALGQTRPRRRPARRDRRNPGSRENAELRRLPPRDGAHRPRARRPRARPAARRRRRTAHPLRTSTPSPPRPPRSPKPTATSRPPPTGTPTPPSAGRRSASSPSRRSPSSARAAASSRSAEPSEASPVLQQAREIFQQLQAAPALAETDALLQQATALSS